MSAILDDLPIAAVLPQLREALRVGHAILQAPTGSGKSTGIPLALLADDWLAERRILILQPRRAAARMIAARLAALLGESLGERVGYQIRFEHRGGPTTRIEVLTEGILTRRIQRDPTLAGVGLIIFDEFHERSLVADLGLALALDLVAGLRPDLRLLLMSATIDPTPLVDLLDGAAIVRGTGRAHPVRIEQAERAPGPDAVAALVAGVRTALASDPGDLLAFLPGAGEIEAAVRRLADLDAEGMRILPLHGSLPSDRQAAALAPSDGRTRRVIIATDIAETSLTIPGIHIVVDSGLTRKPRFDPGSGLTRLVTEACSRDSAAQRAGRAGRLGPGVCWRLWTRAQEASRPARRPPEILQADLAGLALELKLWGVTSPDELRWLDPPPPAAWAQALDLLQRLGALDARGIITRLGRRMAELPIHPRLAALLLGADPAVRADAADLCALLSERDPMRDPPGQRRPADLDPRLRALRDWRAGRAQPWMDEPRLAAVDRVSRQLRRLVRDAPSGTTRGTAELLALAYPERIARRRAAADERYLLASGSGAVLPRDDALALHPYLVIARLDGAVMDGRIQLALPIDEAALRAHAAECLRISRELAWDESREAVIARRVERLGSLVLSSQPVPLESADDPTSILLEALAPRLDTALHWSEPARQLCARIDLLRRLEPDGGWPDLSAQALRAEPARWLGPHLAGMTRLAQVRALDLAAILTEQLDWPRRQRLEQGAPVAIQTPAGAMRRIDYCAGATPVLAVQLQELFGLAATPSVGWGQVPLMLHLLSPARRPVQVTQDLGGFWARAYPEVRKELRGRYPKHAWPEDPTRATPLLGVPRRPRPAG
ncbi:MAG: ATP-dependent helicase HrpB [Sphingobacteriia bacterium]|nr:ATP-dependent helicase HrpB [Sphingobacteriia bacterium]NCC37935.1 ATP-dependent helicase HrpB [Gammaproteobacteria bacterium]